MGLSALFGEWVADLLGQFSEETLEVQGVAVVGLVDLLDCSVDEFVLLL